MILMLWLKFSGLGLGTLSYFLINKKKEKRKKKKSRLGGGGDFFFLLILSPLCFILVNYFKPQVR